MKQSPHEWLAAAFVLAAPCLAQSPAPLPLSDPEGFYTDEASYAPTDVVQIYGNWNAKTIKYRVLHVDTRGGPSQWTVMDETAPETYAELDTLPFGSFVDFKSLNLSELNALTIEGWVQLTDIPAASSIGADEVVIAGQLSLDAGGELTGPAGIGRRADGTLVAVAVTAAQERLEATAPGGTLVEGEWAYVAATWDGIRLRLFKGSDTECATLVGVATASGSGPLEKDSDGNHFRVGARSEAPGDQTGVMDGRVDRWGVWDRAMAMAQLRALQLEGAPSLSCPGAGNAPARTESLLFADFEDAYGTQVADGSGKGNDGVLENHGMRGIAGRPSTDLGLGLHHDQLVDAQFKETPVSFTVGASWPSGLYAIQAVDVSTSGVPGTISLVPLARDYRCFVVRPASVGGDQKVVVIVPVNTWMAYNPWPGDIKTRTAPGLTQRADVDTGGVASYRIQGDNSVYGKMGDGRTTSIYSGWRRPNLWASPVTYLETAVSPPELRNETKAPMDVKFIEWLQDPSDGILAPGSVDFDVFTDWDLDDGTLDLDLYTGSVAVLLGHHEYWSASMLDEFTAERSLSLLTVGGNAIVWRSELATESSGNRVIEIRRWPQDPIEGVPDAMSHILPGQRMGLWRFLRQTGAVGGPVDDHLDYTLGVLLDLGGGLGPPAAFGYWKVAPGMESHWLWGDDVAAGEELLDTGRVVGYEADTYVCPSIRTTACSTDTLDPPGTLPTLFPFSLSGTVSVLAAGSSFGDPNNAGAAWSNSIDWWQPCWDYTDPTSLDAVAGGLAGQCAIYNNDGSMGGTPQTELEGHGNIVYYLRKDGVSGVLTISSNYSPVGLYEKPSSGMNKLSRIAERALSHWLFGISYTGSDVSTFCPPPLTTLAPRR